MMRFLSSRLVWGIVLVIGGALLTIGHIWYLQRWGIVLDGSIRHRRDTILNCLHNQSRSLVGAHPGNHFPFPGSDDWIRFIPARVQ